MKTKRKSFMKYFGPRLIPWALRTNSGDELSGWILAMNSRDNLWGRALGMNTVNDFWGLPPGESPGKEVSFHLCWGAKVALALLQKHHSQLCYIKSISIIILILYSFFTGNVWRLSNFNWFNLQMLRKTVRKYILFIETINHQILH